MEKFEERQCIVLNNNNQKIFGMLHTPLSDSKTPAILICHGLAGTKVGTHRMYVTLSEHLTKLGIAAFRIDFRGSGDSEGPFSEMTFSGEVSDAVVALNFLANDPRIDSKRIGIMGSSFGGAVAASAANDFQKIKGIVLWASIFDVSQWEKSWEIVTTGQVDEAKRHEIMRIDGQLPGMQFYKELFSLDLPTAHNKLAAIPMLHIHGEKDPEFLLNMLINLWLSEKMLRLPRNLCVFPIAIMIFLTPKKKSKQLQKQQIGLKKSYDKYPSKTALGISPKLPKSLANFQNLQIVEGELSENRNLKEIFPKTYSKKFIQFKENDTKVNHKALRVGVVLSGGQAAGGHNVISGLFDALKSMNPKSELLGFLDGPIGIIKSNYKKLDGETIHGYRNQGGFDLIGSGRDKIETPEQFEAAAKTVKELNLDGLVVIGGDDSNTNAALLAEYFLNHDIKTCVAGVPKTIDGDLKNEHIEISFGFDTATKTYSEIIGNILRDSLSAKKYYFFIKLMGRSASHIALECALQTHANMTLIGEEIADKKSTFKQITDDICNMIESRGKTGKNYGVVLIPEGVIEFIPEFKVLISELNKKAELSPESKKCFDSLPKDIQSQLTMDRDPHGNVQVSKIETERLFVEAVQAELKRRKVGKFSVQPLFCGYEGRSCLPSNFDSQYCYALGHVAALLIDNGATGYIACIKKLKETMDNWTIAGIPLTSMIHMEERKGKQIPVIKKALVELDSKAFLDFKSVRESWKTQDDYQYPGPIQFFGPPDLTDSTPLSL